MGVIMVGHSTSSVQLTPVHSNSKVTSEEVLLTVIELHIARCALTGPCLCQHQRLHRRRRRCRRRHQRLVSDSRRHQSGATPHRFIDRYPAQARKCPSTCLKK